MQRTSGTFLKGWSVRSAHALFYKCISATTQVKGSRVQRERATHRVAIDFRTRLLATHLFFIIIIFFLTTCYSFVSCVSRAPHTLLGGPSRWRSEPTPPELTSSDAAAWDCVSDGWINFCAPFAKWGTLSFCIDVTFLIDNAEIPRRTRAV